jgi:hypothetical protein
MERNLMCVSFTFIDTNNLTSNLTLVTYETLLPTTCFGHVSYHHGGTSRIKCNLTFLKIVHKITRGRYPRRVDYLFHMFVSWVAGYWGGMVCQMARGCSSWFQWPVCTESGLTNYKSHTKYVSNFHLKIEIEESWQALLNGNISIRTVVLVTLFDSSFSAASGRENYTVRS